MLADPETTRLEQTPVMSGGPPSSRGVEILSAEIAALSSESTATPPNALLAAEGASVYVYSTDPGFQSAVEAAAEDQYAITPVEDWSELVKALERGDCKIMLLDADDLRGRVEWRIAKLQVSAAWSVIMIAASRERAPYLMELLWQHRIHRLVIKPLGHGVTRILMGSAVVRYRQLRDDPSQRSEPNGEKGKRGGRLVSRLRPRNPQLLATYAILVIAVATMMGLLLAPLPGSPTAEPIVVDVTETLAAEVIDPVDSLVDDLFGQAESALLANSVDLAALALDRIRRLQPDNSRLAFLDHQLERARADEQDQPAFPEPDLSTPLPVVAAIPSLSELDSLLTVADVRLRNGQLILPAGDSAFDYLQRAALLSADDPIVVETRAELREAISVSARTAFDSGDLADTERRVAAARELGAEEAPLVELDAEVAAVRAATAAGLVSARQAELFTNGRDRIEQGQLIAPEQDSAFYYLTTLRADNPNYPDLTAAWQELTDRIAANAVEATRGGDWEAAESWLAGLERVTLDTELLVELRAGFETSRLQEQYLAVAGPPSELLLLSAEPLEYPPDALQADIEGWVDLEFIVGRDGFVGEISVVGAEPEGRFEPEAMASVSTHQYEPFELDGRVYERRLGVRVRFMLE